MEKRDPFQATIFRLHISFLGVWLAQGLTSEGNHSSQTVRMSIEPGYQLLHWTWLLETRLSIEDLSFLEVEIRLFGWFISFWRKYWIKNTERQRYWGVSPKIARCLPMFGWCQTLKIHPKLMFLVVIEMNVIQEFKSAAGLDNITGKSFWLQLFGYFFEVDRHDYNTNNYYRVYLAMLPSWWWLLVAGGVR